MMFRYLIMAEDKKILLIADDDELRESLGKYLEKFFPMRVASVITETEGLEKIRQDIYSLVIADMDMSSISGVDLLKQIKEVNPDIKVLFMTGKVSGISVADAIESGADDIFFKPLDYGFLMEKVEALMR
jgi:DNA-binding NtrC family response regulator